MSSSFSLKGNEEARKEVKRLITDNVDYESCITETTRRVSFL